MGKKKQDNVKDATQVALNTNVTIYVKEGNRIIKEYKAHNKATKNFLLGILINLNTPTPIYRPNYLGIGIGETSESGDEELFDLISPIPSTGPIRFPVTMRFRGMRESKCVCQATVSGNVVNGITLKEFGLFGDQSGESLLARVLIPSGVEVNAGQQLVIEWVISLENKA